MYDSIKPVVLTGSLEGNFLLSFLLGWTVTTGAGIASYPLDTIRRRMMMTSGEVSSSSLSSLPCSKLLNLRCRLSNTSRLWMPLAKLSLLKVLALCSKVLVPTFSVVLLVLVCFPSTTRFSFSCSEKPSRVDQARETRLPICTKLLRWTKDIVFRSGRCSWRKGKECIGKCSTRIPKLLYFRDLIISYLYFSGSHCCTPLGSSFLSSACCKTQIDRCGS